MRPGAAPGPTSVTGGRRVASWNLARASVEMTSAILCTNSGSKLAPNPIGSGNTGARCWATPCRAVPPVVDRHAETRNGGSAVLHLQHLLLQSHARNEIRRPLFGRQGEIEVRGVDSLLTERRGAQRQESNCG